jgi:hypothetical protein
MQSALDMFLRRFITVGRLTVRWPDGRTQIYAGRPGPEAGVLLRDRRTKRDGGSESVSVVTVRSSKYIKNGTAWTAATRVPAVQPVGACPPQSGT